MNMRGSMINTPSIAVFIISIIQYLKGADRLFFDTYFLLNERLTCLETLGGFITWFQGSRAAGFKFQVSGFKIQGSGAAGFKIQDSRFKFQDSRFRAAELRVSGFKIQDSRFRFQVL